MAAGDSNTSNAKIWWILDTEYAAAFCSRRSFAAKSTHSETRRTIRCKNESSAEVCWNITLIEMKTNAVANYFCRREKRDIPFIISACIREVERRGMSEVGVYRVSGSASDLTKLKKSFETSKFF